MSTTARYDASLGDVEAALSSINMPLKDWQKNWAFDFQAGFAAGTSANDAAMKANQFWWYQQNKAIHRDCRKATNCWLPRGHKGERQPRR